MKVYGKEPESLQSIIPLFIESLSDFTLEQIQAAFKLYARRSDEFPTRSDIVGLIERNGKPPLKKEVYVAISKKDPEFRSDDDWQYLREYEAEQNKDFSASEYRDNHRKLEDRQENLRLRDELEKAKKEIARLGEIIRPNLLALKGYTKAELNEILN